MSLSTEKNGWLRVLLIIIPFILTLIIFQIIGYWVMGIDIFNPTSIAETTSFQKAISTSFSLLGTLFILWLFMKFVDKRPFIDLGLHLKNRGKDIFTGLILGFVIMAVGYGMLKVSNELSVTEIVFQMSNFFFLILLFVFVAFAEELITRGYILRNLMQSTNKYIALILSSLIFSAMHGFNPHMSWFSWLSLFLAGILLGITYIYTQNLWFPIALHFSWNFFQSLFGFNVSGQDTYSLIEFSIPSPNLLNGGNFGFEGSYLSLIADILVIVGAIWFYNKKVAISTKNA